MLFAKVAKRGDYVRYAENGTFSRETIWKVISNNGSKVSLKPACHLSATAEAWRDLPKDVEYPPLLLKEGTELVGGKGSKECPYEVN